MTRLNNYDFYRLVRLKLRRHKFLIIKSGKCVRSFVKCKIPSVFFPCVFSFFLNKVFNNNQYKKKTKNFFMVLITKHFLIQKTKNVFSNTFLVIRNSKITLEFKKT